MGGIGERESGIIEESSRSRETRMFAICTVATSIWERNGYRCKGARAAL